MKRFNIFLSASLLILSLNSCSEDSLDLEPYGVGLTKNFYKTPEDVTLAINGAYFPMKRTCDVFDGDYGIASVGTDEVMKGGSSASDQPALTQIETYNVDGNNPSLYTRWTQNYQGIFYVNTFFENVDNVEGVDEDLKNRLLGEAYFLRAYYYFDLVKLFGDVPLMLNTLQVDEFNTQTKNPASEIYAQVIKDFETAIPLLPNKSEYAASDMGRATKGAAIGMLVRVSAYLKNMQDVKKYAEDLFALNEYTIEGVPYASIFQPEGENGANSIFEVQFHSSEDNGWRKGQGNLIATAFGPRANSLGRGGWGFNQAKQELLDEFETGDPRKDATFYEVPEQPYGSGWFIRKYSYAPYSNYQFPAVGGASNGPHNWRVLRLADVYLMYAEATYALGDEDTAREYVNKVRARARGENNDILPDVANTVTGQNLLDAIYHERRVELAVEGLRRYDIIRQDLATDILAPKGFAVGTDEIFPVPQSEIDLNPNLK